MQQRFWIHPLHSDTSAFSAYRVSLEFPDYTAFTVRAVINPTTSTQRVWSSPEASRHMAHVLNSSYPIYTRGLTHQMPNMSLSYLIFFLSCVKIWHKHTVTLGRDVNEMMKYSAFERGFGTVLDRCEFSLWQPQNTRHFNLRQLHWTKHIHQYHVWFFHCNISHTVSRLFAHFQWVWGRRKDKGQQ